MDYFSDLKMNKTSSVKLASAEDGCLVFLAIHPLSVAAPNDAALFPTELESVCARVNGI